MITAFRISVHNLKVSFERGGFGLRFFVSLASKKSDRDQSFIRECDDGLADELCRLNELDGTRHYELPERFAVSRIKKKYCRFSKRGNTCVFRVHYRGINDSRGLPTLPYDVPGLAIYEICEVVKGSY